MLADNNFPVWGGGLGGCHEEWAMDHPFKETSKPNRYKTYPVHPGTVWCSIDFDFVMATNIHSIMSPVALGVYHVMTSVLVFSNPPTI